MSYAEDMEVLMAVDCQTADSNLKVQKLIEVDENVQPNGRKLLGVENCQRSPKSDRETEDVERNSSNGGQEGSDSDEFGIDGKKKRKKRRGKHKGGKHHKRWKPYTKMSWSERQKLEERESKRAHLKRETAFAEGHPVAPYNTTQYLMEDHIQNEAISPDLIVEDPVVIANRSSREEFSGTEDSEDEYIESPDDEEMYMGMAKEFSETYDNIHAERLQMMSKDDLIKDYMELERKLERLQEKDAQRQKRLEECKCGSVISEHSPSKNNTNSARHVKHDSEVTCNVLKEIETLKDENRTLSSEKTRSVEKHNGM